MEKLLPSSRIPGPRDVAPLLAEEKGKADSFTEAQQPCYKSTAAENRVTQQNSDTTNQNNLESVKATLRPSVEEHTSASTELVSQATGERLFVFRDPPESQDNKPSPKRKRKRNFLNLKKCSVAPTP